MSLFFGMNNNFNNQSKNQSPFQNYVNNNNSSTTAESMEVVKQNFENQLIGVFEDSDSDYEEEEVLQKKRKNTTSKKQKTSSYVRGGKKTKGYEVCKQLILALDTIPEGDHLVFMQNFFIKHGITQKQLFSISHSATAVLADLSVLNDDAVRDTIDEINKNQHIEELKTMCLQCEQSDVQTIDLYIKELENQIEETQRRIRFCKYYKHLKTNYKQKIQNLITLLLQISSGLIA